MKFLIVNSNLLCLSATEESSVRTSLKHCCGQGRMGRGVRGIHGHPSYEISYAQSEKNVFYSMYTKLGENH
jgi:hypothetical protein